MKIGDTGRIRAGSGTGRKKKTSGARFSLDLAADVSAGDGVQGTAAVSGLDALLATQGIDGDEHSHQPPRQRAETLLDRLEELHLALLDGSMPRDRLQDLKRLVDQQRDQAEDPEMEGLLSEIETRVLVELAKQEALAAQP